MKSDLLLAPHGIDLQRVVDNGSRSVIAAGMFGKLDSLILALFNMLVPVTLGNITEEPINIREERE